LVSIYAMAYRYVFPVPKVDLDLATYLESSVSEDGAVFEQLEKANATHFRQKGTPWPRIAQFETKAIIIAQPS
jgi:hypothetical protein